MDVNETNQWTRLFIPSHCHYGIINIYFYIYSNIYIFLRYFFIQEYLHLKYPSFCYETWQTCLMYTQYLSRKFYKYTSISFALAFNLLCFAILAFYPSEKFCTSFISYIFYTNITPLDTYDALEICLKKHKITHLTCGSIYRPIVFLLSFLSLLSQFFLFSIYP